MIIFFLSRGPSYSFECDSPHSFGADADESGGSMRDIFTSPHPSIRQAGLGGLSPDATLSSTVFLYSSIDVVI